MATIVGTIAAGVIIITALLLACIWIVEAIRYAEFRINQEDYEARRERRERYYMINTNVISMKGRK